MRLSTRGRFAVTALIDLGLHQQRGPVPLAAIGLRQRISVSYLEQLFGKLRRHQLVESTRGPGGGYRLARPSETISVADIVMAVDRPEPERDAEREHGFDDRCSTQALWTNLNRHVIDFLCSVSLRDLTEQRGGQESKAWAPADSRRQGFGIPLEVR